jgi:hypothetical protein
MEIIVKILEDWFKEHDIASSVFPRVVGAYKVTALLLLVLTFASLMTTLTECFK